MPPPKPSDQTDVDFSASSRSFLRNLWRRNIGVRGVIDLLPLLKASTLGL